MNLAELEAMNIEALKNNAEKARIAFETGRPAREAVLNQLLILGLATLEVVKDQSEGLIIAGEAARAMDYNPRT